MSCTFFSLAIALSARMMSSGRSKTWCLARSSSTSYIHEPCRPPWLSSRRTCGLGAPPARRAAASRACARHRLLEPRRGALHEAGRSRRAAATGGPERSARRGARRARPDRILSYSAAQRGRPEPRLGLSLYSNVSMHWTTTAPSRSRLIAPRARPPALPALFSPTRRTPDTRQSAFRDRRRSTGLVTICVSR